MEGCIVSELRNVRIYFFPFGMKLESVRDGSVKIGSDRKVSEIAQFGKCQDWTGQRGVYMSLRERLHEL